MGLRNVWKKYRVLIVMGTGLALVHWGWYNIKSNPIFRQERQESVPVAGIVEYVLEKETAAKAK